MADSTIGALPSVSELADNSLLVVEQSGSAQKLTGAQIREFAETAAGAEAKKAAASAAGAESSAADAAASAAAAEAAKEGMDEKVAAAAASAAEAAGNASDAADSEAAAQAAQTAAETAKAGAVSAKTAAESAKTAAQTAKTGADSAKSAAETARDAAKSAQTAAASSAATASAKATAAAGSAESANDAKTAAESAKTAAQTARDAIMNMNVEAVTLATGQAATVEKSLVDSVYKLTFGLPQGADAPTITNISVRQSDYHLIVTLSNGTTYDAGYCRGAAGQGSGNMSAATYDPQGKAQDIFAYTDAAVYEKIAEHDNSDSSHSDIRYDVSNSKAYFIYLDGSVQDGNLTLAGDPGQLTELAQIYMAQVGSFMQPEELPYVYTHFASDSNPTATPVILPFVGVDKAGTGMIFAGTYFDKDQSNLLYAISVGVQMGSGVIVPRNIRCEVISGRLGTSGNGSNVTAAFTQASSRANIATGETLATLFGKIKKWFADLGSMAFKSSVAKSDLAADVQTSLGLADSALQSAPVTSVNGKTGAVTVSVPVAATATPLMDGTASVGSGTAYALGNHRHPTDTTRVPTTRTVNGKALSSNITLGATYTATLLATEWDETIDAGWVTQTVTVSGLKASYNAAPFVDVALSGTDATGDAELSAAWMAISATAVVNTGANSITVKFPGGTESPTVNIPIRITVYD